MEINQAFLHHLSISFRGNDDEHPVVLLVPEAPTKGSIFYDRNMLPLLGPLVQESQGALQFVPDYLYGTRTYDVLV